MKTKLTATRDTLTEDVLRLPASVMVRYEMARAWWPQFVSAEWMQSLAARYFAWKTRRIFARFRAQYEMRERVNSATEASERTARAGGNKE